MKLINIFLTLTLSLITLNSFSGEITAPLGFTWGESKDDMIEKGVVFGGCETRGILMCVIVTPLRSISYVSAMVAGFDKEEGLIGVSIATNEITYDIYGHEGVDSYSNMKINISKLYGEPDSYEYTGRSLFTESDEFYQCLSYAGCGTYTSFWSKNGTAISLEIVGVGKGKGHLVMQYQYKEYEAAIDEANLERSNSDLDAL